MTTSLPVLPAFFFKHLARVADALLLVGIRLAHAADVGGDLADQLAVDAGHGDVRLLVDRDRRSRWGCRTRPGASSRARRSTCLPLTSRAVADADDVEVLRKPSVTPLTALATRLRARPWNLPSSGSSRSVFAVQLVAGDLEADARRQRLAQLALRALHFDGARLDVDLHALRGSG